MKSSFLNKILRNFFLSEIDKFFFNLFEKNKNVKNDINDTVLVQCVEDYAYYTVFGLTVSELKKQNNINVEQYVLRNLYIGSTNSISGFIKSILLGNRFRDNKWIKLYSSFCDDIAYRHEGTTTISYDISALFKAYTIFSNLKSKDELIALKIDNLYVGDLIYDSYLRFKPAPTVDTKNIYLLIVIWQTLRSIKITDDYFKKKKPKVLLTSYSTYIQHGVAVRIALLHDTKVLSFGNNQTLYKQLSKDDFYHTADFKNYKTNFTLIRNQKEYLEKSKKALDNRLSGIKDIATSYMKESAYKFDNSAILPDIDGKVVIFLHDFFDSPHVYGNIIFNDFLEWIEFTIKVLDENQIPYYIKPHPNQVGDSVTVINELKKKYPHLKFLSTKITNKQLVSSGIKVGISVYGTVAHELAYMGIPVILCAENPHSSYSFCYEAKDIKEYIDFLKSYDRLKIIDNYKEEVESFYYMHNRYLEDNHELMSSLIKLRELSINFNVNKNKEEFMKYIEDISFSRGFKNLQNDILKCFK